MAYRRYRKKRNIAREVISDTTDIANHLSWIGCIILGIFSFQVATSDQDETDGFWNAIVGNGGEERVEINNSLFVSLSLSSLLQLILELN